MTAKVKVRRPQYGAPAWFWSIGFTVFFLVGLAREDYAYALLMGLVAALNIAMAVRDEMWVRRMRRMVVDSAVGWPDATKVDITLHR